MPVVAYGFSCCCCRDSCSKELIGFLCIFIEQCSLLLPADPVVVQHWSRILFGIEFIHTAVDDEGGGGGTESWIRS